MPVIAHLSDLHLLEADYGRRRGVARLQVEYLSLKRKLDPEERTTRARIALASAAAARPDHLILTGDLTEDGSPGQFALLRELLDECGLLPEQITLTPGNHDAHGIAWAEALAGPLDRWAAGARPAAVTPIAGGRIVNVNTILLQPFWKSGGYAPGDQLAEVARVAEAEDGAVILAQHHPPFRVRHQWVHGLHNFREVLGLLLARPSVSLLYGHLHRQRDVEFRGGEGPRAFAPAAVAESDQPLRLYNLEESRLVPIPECLSAAA